jgi:hypothetical protein
MDPIKWFKTVRDKSGLCSNFFVEICPHCNQPYLSNRFVVARDEDCDRWQQEVAQNKENVKKIEKRSIIFLSIISSLIPLLSFLIIPMDSLQKEFIFFLFFILLLAVNGFVAMKIAKIFGKKLVRKYPVSDSVRKEIFSKLIADQKLPPDTDFKQVDLKVYSFNSLQDYQLISETTYKRYTQYEDDMKCAELRNC